MFLNPSKMASWRVNLKLHFKKGKACGLAKKNELYILIPCVVTWFGEKKKKGYIRRGIARRAHYPHLLTGNRDHLVS